ncbi:MAG: hypothetical protein K9G80_11840 [Candidatus Nanopelagicales bacterium]|nr:hypothetical protein [Candidatus Nanopelagicales bacterium]
MRRSLVAAALTASSLLLASCAMPADDPNWNAEEAEAVEFAEDDAEAAAEEADAVASLDTALANPTSIGVDAPLTAAPDSGLVIISLSDGSESDALVAASMTEAAEALGWTVEEVAGAESELTAGDAIAEAVAAAPAGIRISGSFLEAMADGLAAAETAGIPVVCTGCGSEVVPGVTDASLNGAEQNVAWGEVLGAYVFANKGVDEDAGVEVFRLPSGAIGEFAASFDGTLSTLCRECSTTDEPIDELVDDVPFFVSDTMSISLGRWALLTSGDLSAGVPEILETTDVFEPVVLIGRAASAADIAVLQGTAPAEPLAADGGDAIAADEAEAAAEEAAALGEDTAEEGLATPEQAASLQAWTALPYPVLGWRVIDQFARIIVGDPVATGPLPSQLITPVNAGEVVLDEAGNYIGIADFKEQLLALWGVK